MARLTRRSFIRSTLIGLVVTIAAPVLARFKPCKHMAFESGPGIDGVRCLDCGERIGAGIVWNNFLFVAPENPYGRVEYYPLPSLRGSMIRFRRDPSKVFEL